MWQEPSIKASAKQCEGAPFFFPHFSGPFLQFFPSFFEAALIQIHIVWQTVSFQVPLQHFCRFPEGGQDWCYQ
jgi:hypothetical protein